MNAYLSNYSADWTQKHPGLRISEVSIDDFNKYRVVVACDENGQWVLTAFDTVTPKKDKTKT